MKQIYSLALFTAIIAVTMQCKFLDEFERGNGNIISEKRTVDEFSSIKIGGNFDVTLVPDEIPSIKIITDENLVSFIDTEVRDDQLVITQKKKLFSTSKIKLIIEYSDLEKVKVTGAALLKNEDIIRQEKLEIRMEGAGMIDLLIESESLKVVLSGAGIVKLAGDTDFQELNLAGAGKLEAYDLKSKSCKITVGGIGGAKVYVTEELDATIEGIGGIEYRGNPEKVHTEISGLGSISESNDY